MCEISCKNSERLLRKRQKNFRGYFFCRTLYISLCVCQGDEHAAVTQLVCHVHYRPDVTSRWVRLAQLLLSQFADTHQSQVTHCCQVAVNSSDINVHSVCLSLCPSVILPVTNCCRVQRNFGLSSFLDLSHDLGKSLKTKIQSKNIQSLSRGQVQS